MALIKVAKVSTSISLFELAAPSSGGLDIGAQLWWVVLEGEGILECRNLFDILFWSYSGLGAAHPKSEISLLVGVAGLFHVDGAMALLLLVFPEIRQQSDTADQAMMDLQQNGSSNQWAGPASYSDAVMRYVLSQSSGQRLVREWRERRQEQC